MKRRFVHIEEALSELEKKPLIEQEAWRGCYIPVPIKYLTVKPLYMTTTKLGKLFYE